MNETLIVTSTLGILGLVMGSFAGATMWRLRALQLREDTAAGEKVRGDEKKQVKKLQKRSLSSDRSVCLHCGHQLAWYDLIPLASWVSLLGKCRYCHKRIGYFEPLIEIGLAVFFVLSYVFWPYPLSDAFDITRFVLWLVAAVGLTVLCAYDARWYLLPNRVVFPLIGIGLVNAGVVLVQEGFSYDAIMNIINALLVLSGFYYLIYVLSKHAWIGFGDVKLGLVLALMLADWQLALLALFLANAIGTVVIVPLMAIGKITRGTHVPFGPLLIAGFAIAGIFGQEIITWYTRLVLGA